MKRWHEEQHIARREMMEYLRAGHASHPKAFQVGRYRKMSGFDCGNPKCGICRRIEKGCKSTDDRKAIRDQDK